ncbi:MAG: hypothetical protein KDI29_16755 [Pseudomonadales bacterium]|nr:hypothetical protein [Pseudomonadales bacterium]
MTADNGNQPDKRNNTEDERQFEKQLHRISRSRSHMLVCFYTLPLYIVALILLLNEGRGVTFFMFVYMAVYAAFALDMVLRKCPRCGEQFFVRILFLNFVTRQCVHCGLSCRPRGNGGSTDGGRHF